MQAVKSQTQLVKSGVLGADAGTALFSFGFCVYLIIRILFTTTISTMGFGSLLKAAMYFSVAVVLLSLLFGRRVSVKSLCLVAFLIVLAILAWRVGGSDLAYLMLMACASRRYGFRSLLSLSFKTIACTCIIVVLLASVGCIGSVSSVDSFRVRNSCGFIWVSFLSHYYLELTICFAILVADRLSLRHLLLLAVIDCAIYMVTGSRNSFVLTLLFLVAVAFWLLFRKKKPCSSLCAVIICLSFCLAAVLSFVIYLAFDPFVGVGLQINTALSGRMLLTQRAVELYGLSAFGTQIQWVTQSMVAGGQFAAEQYSYVDSSYLNILINYGWVFAFFVLVALSVIAYRCTKNCGLILGIAFFTFAIHGIVDPQLLDLHYCVFLLLLGNVFDSQEQWGAKLADFNVARGGA